MISWWLLPDSNWGHKALQASALPTELKSRLGGNFDYFTRERRFSQGYLPISLLTMPVSSDGSTTNVFWLGSDDTFSSVCNVRILIPPGVLAKVAAASAIP